MKLVCAVALLAVAVTYVDARPRYIAIPLDNVQVVEVDEYPAGVDQHRSLRIPRRAASYSDEVESLRIPRRAASYSDEVESLRIPRRAASYEEPEAEADDDTLRFQRQAGGGGGGGHDHVDYGAHTGHHGAFGWYADFPVHTGN